MLSPISAVARRVASTKSTRSAPTASTSGPVIEAALTSRSGSITDAAVGSSRVLTTARVRPGSTVASTGPLAATTMSQPSTRSQPPAAMRWPTSCSGAGASRTWLVTAPFFCAAPVLSSTEQPLPSRWAAMPSSAPTVSTPVPPMPVTRML